MAATSRSHIKPFLICHKNFSCVLLWQKGAKIDVRSAVSVKKVKVLLKQFTAPHTNDEISRLTLFTPPSYIYNALLLLLSVPYC